ncbi:MAG: DinB family protein [Candidatus Hydrogenedentota bacterium]
MKDSAVIANFTNIRVATHKLVADYGPEHLLIVPPGASNNILWNFGHIITDGAEMLYQSNNLESPIPEEFRPLFLEKTSPADWKSTPDIKQVLDASQAFTDAITQNYASGVFAEFDPKSVDSAWPLNSIEKAIAYHTVHEALHMGYIMALNRIISDQP